MVVMIPPAKPVDSGSVSALYGKVKKKEDSEGLKRPADERDYPDSGLRIPSLFIYSQYP